MSSAFAASIGEYRRRWEDRGGRRRGERQGKEVTRTAADEAADSYYGLPVIHKPHWDWRIVTYFAFSGISAGSAIVSSLADLSGQESNRSIVGIGRYVSLIALLPGPPLLIWDLGRPERFYRMLRIVKFRSPMSVGVWTLLVHSGFVAHLATAEGREAGFLPGKLFPLVLLWPPKVVGAIGLPVAALLGGYTGVLLSATAVPLWGRAAPLLGPLFLTSGLTTGTSAVSLGLAAASRVDWGAVERLAGVERVTALTEFGLLLGAKRRLGYLGEPLEFGRAGLALRYGSELLGLGLPLALRLANRRLRSRPLTIAASLLTLGGGWALRYAIVTAGLHSADDPHATFAYTSRE